MIFASHSSLQAPVEAVVNSSAGGGATEVGAVVASDSAANPLTPLTVSTLIVNS